MKIGIIEILLFVVLSVIWGSSFYLMKHAMYDTNGNPIFTNQQVASLRVLIAGSSLLPVAIYNIKKLMNFKVLSSVMIVGIFGNFIPAFLFTYAQTGLLSAYVGMLNSATPLFSVLIAYFVFKDVLSKRHLIGLLIGIVGVVLLMNTYVSDQKFDGGFWHIFAVIFATLCYGISLNVIKFRLKEVSALHITSFAFLIIFLPGLFVFFWFKTPAVFIENPLAWTGMSYILVLSLLGTVLGVYLYAILIARTQPIFSSMVTFAMPIVALFIGYFDGEKIQWIQVLGLAIICLGIFVANKRIAKKNSVKLDLIKP